MVSVTEDTDVADVRRLLVDRGVEPPADAAPVAAHEDDDETSLTAVRRTTAQRLTESATTIPHFYLTSVVDVGRLLAFRAEINQRPLAGGTKVSVTTYSSAPAR